MNNKKFLENIRGKYQKYGVENFYKYHSSKYINPHEPIINKSIKYIDKELDIDFSNVLDLAAGTGEITNALMELGYNNIEGLDPYTCEIYKKRTGKNCYKMSFDDIMKGNLNKKYSSIICSFALHLTDKSKLPMIIWRISEMTNDFILMSPHKRPIIKNNWGLELKKSLNINRVKIKYFKK